MIEIITTILGGPIGQLVTREAATLLRHGINKIKRSLRVPIEGEDSITIEEEYAMMLKAEHGINDPGKKSI